MTARIDLAGASPTELLQLAETAEALRIRPGQRSLATRAALALCDDAIRELARRYHPGRCRHQQAMAIHTELFRYSTSTWTRTCSDAECRHRDARRALVWQILRLRGGRVPKVRLLDDILAYRTRR